MNLYKIINTSLHVEKCITNVVDNQLNPYKLPYSKVWVESILNPTWKITLNQDLEILT